MKLFGRHSISFSVDDFRFEVFLLYIYIFSLIFLSGIEIGNLISKALGLMLVFVFILFSILVNKKKIKLPEESRFIFLWLIIGLLSGVNANDQLLFFSRLLTIVQLILFYYIGYQIIINSKVKRNVIFGVIIFSALMVFMQGLMMKSGSNPLQGDTRLYSAQGNANTIANFGVYSFLFILYFIFSENNKYRKMFFIFLGLFFLYGILETESRKGMLSIPILVFIYLFFHYKNQYHLSANKFKFSIKIFALLILIITVLVAGIFFFSKTQYFDRFQKLTLFIEMQSGGNESAFKKIWDYSTYERRQFIKYGIKMWQDNFWIGTGLDNFKSKIHEYWTISRSAYAHNNYVELLSTMGILGFSFYYLIYISIFRKLFYVYSFRNSKFLEKQDEILVRIFITGLFTLLFIEFVIVSYYLKFIWLILLVISAYTDIIKNKIDDLHI